MPPACLGWAAQRPPGTLPPVGALGVLGALRALGAIGECRIASGSLSLNCAGPGAASEVAPEAPM
eukprot:3323627-Alexandrium_andersonii.AAC.1